MFDAQCDFVAVVYGVKDNPDRLLLDFTEDLRRSAVPVVHERNLAATGCRLDCRKLASIAKMIEAAIQEGPDLVVINRFGKLEATGKARSN
jgi:hypothetical protein